MTPPARSLGRSTPLPARLRKTWHILRRGMGAGVTRPTHLVVSKARWQYDAQSPVMLGIDDLTNAWHSVRGGATWDPGGDWGAGGWQPGSALRLLEERLLRDFPEARVTFFTVAGPISPYTHSGPFGYAASLDASETSVQFFRSLAADPRFELGYHGWNHGRPGDRSDEFTQEWQGFASVEDAVVQTRRGLELFERVIGRRPSGGKYGGYAYNRHSEQALAECGFVWWCRDWTPRDTTGRVDDAYYEPAFFGSDLLVALPSTVHGFLWDQRQVDRLLAMRQVISIAEHISPVRPDGRVQTPNMVDDMTELRRLYRYLRDKNVWHATGSEIASYVIARERTIIYDVSAESFSLRYDGQVPRALLTLHLDASAVCSSGAPKVDVFLPDGTRADTSGWRWDCDRHRHVVTVPVINGIYRVLPAESSNHAA
jgi:hypothetical protein